MDKPAVLVNMPPGTKIIFLGAIIMVSTAVFILLGSYAAFRLYGLNLLENPDIFNHLKDKTSLSALKLMQILQHIGMFIVPVLVFSYLANAKPYKALGLSKSVSAPSLILSILLMFAAMPMINWMVMINEAMVFPDFLAPVETWIRNTEESAGKITDAFLKMDNRGELVLNLVMIALIPAIGEELLFRGALQRLISEWTNSPHWGILIASVFFSALHLQFFGFIPRMMLGVLFGYLFLWSGSLWLPICCHFINNGSAVVFVFLENKGIYSIDPDTCVGTNGQELIFTLLSALSVTFLLLIVYRKEVVSSKNLKIEEK